MGSVIQLKNKVNNAYLDLKNSVDDKIILVEEKIKNKLISDVSLVEKMTSYNLEATSIFPLSTTFTPTFESSFERTSDNCFPTRSLHQGTLLALFLKFGTDTVGEAKTDD